MDISDLTVLCDAARRAWPVGWWTPGEICWEAATGTADQEVRVDGDSVWWRMDDNGVAVTHSGGLGVDLHWVLPLAIEVPTHDGRLIAALTSAGFEADDDAPFGLDLRATPSQVRGPHPAGFVVRGARAEDDLVEIHRASWRPDDLPYATGLAPPTDPAATSSFTHDKLRAVQATTAYDLDGHLVAVAPDGQLAGSCIVWADAELSVASIEPLGVRPQHRRIGVAGALCAAAADLAAARDLREVVIHPRGDAAYPAARAAYLQAGFEVCGRTRLYRRPSR